MALAKPRLVELPGIELGTKMRVTCENVQYDYVIARETARNDLGKRGSC